MNITVKKVVYCKTHRSNDFIILDLALINTMESILKVKTTFHLCDNKHEQHAHVSEANSQQMFLFDYYEKYHNIDEFTYNHNQ